MVTTPGTFVGRQREMGVLQAALDDALSGQGRLVMLVGEPGIGKTRTAQELAALAGQRGAQVLWGWCYEEAGAPPYWPWVQSLRSYVQKRDADHLRSEIGPGAADIAEIIPELRESLPGLEPPPVLDSPEANRFRLFDSITTLLKNTAQSQPLLLVLDDLQWADQPSLLLLRFLARQIGESRLLVVGTYRDVELSRQHPLSETLAQLSREPAFRRVPLLGLSRDDSGHLIETTAGIRPSGTLVDSIHERTEGNPFFITEVVRLLTAQGELDRRDAGRPQAIRIPEGVRQAIGHRLNRLPAQCNQVLTTASIIGREFGFRQLQHIMADISGDQVLQALESALAVGVIQELPGSAERYLFTHALIQQTLAHELSGVRRVRLHARIGQALEELYGADAEAHAAELVYHFAEALPVTGPEKVVHYSLLAGERALASYAWEEAVAHYQTALELLEELEADPRHQAEVQEKLALVTSLGSGKGGVSYLEKALSIYENLGDSKKAGEVHLRLGNRVEGDLDSGRRYSHNVEAVALLEPEGESLQLARAYVQLGDNAFHGFGDRSIGLPLMEKGLALAERLGDTAGVIEAAKWLAHAMVYHTGEIQPGFALYQRCYEEARKMGNLVTLSEAAIDLSREYSPLRASEDALEWAERAADASKQAGTARQQIMSALALAWACVLLGDAARARLNVDTAEQLARRAGVDIGPGNFGSGGITSVPARVNIFVGEWNKAEKELLHYLLKGTGISRFWVSPTLGWLYLERSDLVRAKMHLEETATFCHTSGDYPPELLASALLVQVCCKGGELEEAADHMRRAKEIFSLSPDWYGLAAEVHHADGVLAATQQRWPEAEMAFQKSVEINRQFHLPYYEARTLLEQGQMHLARNGPDDRQQGMQLLDQALAIFQRIQATKMVEKVLGLRERAESLPTKGPVYPAGLTKRQVDVLLLLAEGKTNREIAGELVLSERTVQRHVADIYLKIAARNRSEATAFALSKLYPAK